MIKDKIRQISEIAIRELWNSSVVPEIEVARAASPAPGGAGRQFGDYSIKASFMLAKSLGKSPAEIADIIAKEINENLPVSAEIDKVEAVGGYVNFFLTNDFLRKELKRIHKIGAKYGVASIGKGKKVIVEYSQPNIAKKMHIGHLRTTVLGDALANIYDRLGYKVVRWNYLGDWGTQFGKLIAAYKLWGNKAAVEARPIDALLELYVRFHREFKEHPELESRGQAEFLKLESGDKENLKLWKWFKKVSLVEFKKVYKELGIKFNVWIGENHFEPELKPLVEDLMKRGIAEAGEGGAVIIKLDKPGVTGQEAVLPPALIQKSDGASLYLTRDIANLKYRLKKYGPERILYVVGNEQSLHFQQLFAVAKLLGLESAELAHIKYGLVLGEDRRKMATREGEAIALEEVIGKAVGLAREIVDKKNPDLDEGHRAKIAHTVAVGALKYEMLKEHRNSDIVFSWTKMLDFSGNSAPYLQYTYARLASILKKAGQIGGADLARLTNSAEFNIVKHLLEFPDTIADSARAYLTNNLALYLYELANLANQFYETTPILKDDDIFRRHARLVLISAISAILKSGLGLLGINVLERI